MGPSRDRPGAWEGACHKELEHKVENLKHMQLEVMQREIKNKYELPAYE